MKCKCNNTKFLINTRTIDNKKCKLLTCNKCFKKYSNNPKAFINTEKLINGKHASLYIKFDTNSTPIFLEKW